MEFSVTLVVTLHNSENDLKDFISFLVNQTFKNFYVIFVDDFSSDHTVFVLKEILKSTKLSFCILETPNNQGAGKARDFALDSGLIQSKYVVFLDPDDEPLENFVLYLLTKADQTDADIVMCGYERRSRNGKKLITTEMVNNPDVVTDTKKCMILPYLNPAPWNKLYKVSVIKDSRFVFRGGGEDELFLLKVLPRCKTLAFLNVVLYRYYVHPKSLISNTDYQLFSGIRKGYAEAKVFYQSHGVDFENFEDFLDASVFVRFGIGATTRFCLSYPKMTKRVLKENALFFKTNFPNWFSNPYLTFASSFRAGFKGLMVWRCKWLFKIGLFRLFLFDYKLFTCVFKKDFKW